MTYSQTINASDMRRINRSAVLELIRTVNPISRTEIAARLMLSLPTVMRIVDELIEENLVIPTGDMEASNGGRRRELLKFNDTGHVVVGVDLGGTKMYGAVSTLGGDILYEKTINYHGMSGDSAFQGLIQLLDNLIDHVPGYTAVRGIGVGAPGVTLHHEGIVKWAPSLNWRDFPLAARLASHYDYPIIVDNDVNLAVLGELWFGLDERVQNMVLIAIGTGIGAGIIIDGTLFRGSNEASGEVGYFLLNPRFLGKRYDGFGAFESIASGTGIAERAENTLHGLPEPPTAERVLAAAYNGEAWAEQIVDETIDYIAMAIANICTLLDLEIIMIGGGVSKSAELLVQPILQRLDGTIPHQPDIRVSRLGTRAAVMGTIARILQHTADYYVVHRLS